MSKERFEIFGKIIKDNEEMPNLLDNYLATVRLNEFNEKVKELEQDLEFTTKTANDLIEIKHKLEQELEEFKEKAIVPKFKKDDYVYALFTQTEIYKGQIDAFDYYTNSYLIYPNEDIGNEWIKADKVFKTKFETEKKLQELRGGE